MMNIMDSYPCRHAIDLDPMSISVIRFGAYGWIQGGGWSFTTAEYVRGDDDRVMMSQEFYEDADRKWFVAPDYPIVGSVINIMGIKLKIDGFYSRFSIPRQQSVHDVVASLI